MSTEKMTAGERTDLQRLARMNAKVAKADVDAVVAERHSAFVADLNRDWSAQELQVQELLDEANATIEAINTKIQARCDAEGITAALRPRMVAALALSPRYDRQGLVEMKAKARAELDAAGKRAKVEIDRQVAQVCADVIGCGLSSAEAHRFLDRVQSPSELVAPLDPTKFGVRELGVSG